MKLTGIGPGMRKSAIGALQCPKAERAHASGAQSPGPSQRPTGNTGRPVSALPDVLRPLFDERSHAR